MENVESQDLKKIKEMLESLSQKQSDNDIMLKAIDKTLSQLNQTVIGNPQYGLKGIINEISDLKEYVQNDRTFKNKMIGGLLVVGTVWTALLQYLFRLFTHK
jgi:hypothetical protein